MLGLRPRPAREAPPSPPPGVPDLSQPRRRAGELARAPDPVLWLAGPRRRPVAAAVPPARHSDAGPHAEALPVAARGPGPLSNLASFKSREGRPTACWPVTRGRAARTLEPSRRKPAGRHTGAVTRPC